MLISAAVVILSIIVCRILSRRGISLPRNVVVVVFALELIGVSYSAYTKWEYASGFDGTLHRNDVGGRDYEETLSIVSEDSINTPRPIDIEVKARVPTEEEAFILIDRAIEEIESGFLGENETTESVTMPVSIRDYYADELVEAAWYFDGHGIMASDGTIRWDKYSEPIEVKAVCELTCGDYGSQYEISFTVTEPAANTDEGFIYRLNRALSESDDASRTDEVWNLPDVVAGNRVKWAKKKDNTGLEITLFGVAAGGVLLLAGREEEKRKSRLRIKELSRDYPEIVSRLSLYVGAGFGLKSAFARVGEQYAVWKTEHTNSSRPGYEAIVTMNRRMADGMGEAEAYRLLGEDTAHKDYRKLALLLRQNLRKGSRDMIDRLEKEERIAYDERRTLAKIAGEEASTKLLLPMMMLLLILLIVLIVPAWAGMGAT